MGIPQPTAETAASELPRLTADDVRSLTDEQSWSRGRSYRLSHAIFDPVRRGNRLQARCHGSSGGPYHVRATLAPTGAGQPPVESWSCDCPRGGFCKHIVALLLTWVEAPAEFEERPALSDLLAERSREELLALIDRLVDRMPELERAIDKLVPVRIEIPPATPGAGATTSVDLAAIRRKVTAAFQRREYDDDDEGSWYGDAEEGDDHEIAEEIAALRAIGDQYAAAGRWADAQAVYTVLVEQVLAHEDVGALDGPIGDAVHDCGVGLLRCLEAQAELPAADRLPPAARRRLIETVLDLWQWAFDIPSYGGFFMGTLEQGLALVEPEAVDMVAALEEAAPHDPAEADVEYAFDPAAVLRRAATAAEREHVRSRLQVLTRPDGGTGVSLRREAVEFLFKLEPASEATPEARLAAYKRAELWADAIALLLAAGRSEEAVALAGRRLTTVGAALSFANRLAERGGADLDRAIAFIDGRLWETEGKNPHDDMQYLTWLASTYARHGRPREALATELRRFKLRPAFDVYRAIRAAAQLPGQDEGAWARTRPDLLAEFRTQKQWGDLIDAHLEAGEVAEALAALAQMEKKEPRPQPLAYGSGWLGGYLSVGDLPASRRKVALAARETFPDEAIRLFRLLADRAIDTRNRDGYRQAARDLAEVKRLLEAQGRADEWRALIASLREQHKRLRALKEELLAAGL